MFEPRGHADMYGVLITDPVEVGSDFSVLFLHNESDSSMCGYGIIATCKVAIEIGHIVPTTFPHNIKIDSPAGLVSAWVDRTSTGDINVWFNNVPSFAHLLICYMVRL
jgi:proline racemase